MSEKEYESNIDDSHAFPKAPQSFETTTESNTESPLFFAVRINGNYYVSFKKGKFWCIIGISVVWALLNWFIFSVVQTYQNISDTIKEIIKISLILQIILYLIVCLVDAGTIFQDQEDSLSGNRIYCTTCKLYRKRNTKHCIWCNRCTKYYDHHCSVFGKCIGKRNLVPFWVFIMISGFEMPALIVITITNIFSGM